jgi:hypothetical protein
MSGYDLHSLILACDFRVDDVDLMWKWLKKHNDGLLSIGAHHVVPLHVNLGAPPGTGDHRDWHARSVRDVLRSPAIFEWFSISGADDIPPIFGGEVVEKVDLDRPTADEHAGRVVVGVMATVEDVSELMAKVHDGLERFKGGAVRKIWGYQALDDGREAMILQEIEDEVAARQWIEHPDAAAEWMSAAGLGAYPSQFVGRFAHLMAVGEKV